MSPAPDQSILAALTGYPHRQGAGTGGWLAVYCMIRSGLVRGSQETHGEAHEVAGAPLIRLAHVVGRCSDASPCGV
jgi:hypothetical protein